MKLLKMGTSVLLLVVCVVCFFVVYEGKAESDNMNKEIFYAHGLTLQRESTVEQTIPELGDNRISPFVYSTAIILFGSAFVYARRMRKRKEIQ